MDVKQFWSVLIVGLVITTSIAIEIQLEVSFDSGSTWMKRPPLFISLDSPNPSSISTYTLPPLSTIKSPFSSYFIRLIDTDNPSIVLSSVPLSSCAYVIGESLRIALDSRAIPYAIAVDHAFYANCSSDWKDYENAVKDGWRMEKESKVTLDLQANYESMWRVSREAHFEKGESKKNEEYREGQEQSERAQESTGWSYYPGLLSKYWHVLGIVAVVVAMNLMREIGKVAASMESTTGSGAQGGAVSTTGTTSSRGATKTMKRTRK
uniref:Uncharacterized protein n=1 Tax=Timspurckia oligopyrenoides TaxID=708627 RepID=A0A7S0ZHG2_9RHOD|mmetsp:Transcript_5464/g.9630  ORF Transcript_5464/g.9630 Transcript_5464/m.9630 type:complete len:265 (+) Transcript_5464:69-863(+)|eukprot:CAMPEP_0182448046 /NCGR_PEP_ID=MMETSP1172-20130603/23090_1 /TAXON_ID=708627 /ORGANISM="Timspurckia oligopyrenoides, Strain CCMP3278" /LENGTH=264 /DNA_ID=CAMNT_0024644755 /DNA_START=24 /DNA_END=818 /DNA_ORIENTATION=-